jgi:hypothetical protein
VITDPTIRPGSDFSDDAAAHGAPQERRGLLAFFMLDSSLRPRNSGVLAMVPSAAECQLRDRFFQVMLEATFSLQKGPDQELILQALISAAERLRERFEHELEELRQESD